MTKEAEYKLAITESQPQSLVKENIETSAQRRIARLLNYLNQEIASPGMPIGFRRPLQLVVEILLEIIEDLEVNKVP